MLNEKEAYEYNAIVHGSYSMTGEGLDLSLVDTNELKEALDLISKEIDERKDDNVENDEIIANMFEKVKEELNSRNA